MELTKMTADCRITFKDNPDKVIFSGQNVTALIDIDVYKPLRVNKLTLHFEGIGECEWREQTHVRASKGGFREDYIVRRGRDQYFNAAVHLIATETEILPGHHTYNFNFEVPLGLPSSANEKNGRISYRAVVVFNRPWKFDLKFETSFIVICTNDLNLNPKLKVPVQREDVKNYNYLLCCLWRPLTLAASIPHRGFIAGQVIPVTVTIDNPHRTHINQIEATLTKHVKYTSQSYYYSKYIFDQIRMDRAIFGRDYSGAKQAQYKIDLKIPGNAALTTYFASVVQIYYKLKIELFTARWHKDPVVLFPITIGTVPITTEIVPMTMEAVPIISETVPKATETVPKATETVHMIIEAVSKATGAVPKVTEAVPMIVETEAVPMIVETEAVPNSPEAVKNATATEAVPST